MSDDGMFYENILLGLFGLAPVVAAALLYLLFARYRLHRRRSRRVLHLLIGNALVLIMLLGALLFAGEVYYRFVYDTTESYGLSRTTREWFERHYKINRSGVRDSLPEYPQRMAPGKRRITVVGDSFTAGHGVANVEDRFANRIRRARPQWEVHLFAGNAYETAYEMKLVVLGAQGGYQYDVVLLVYCLNDISDLIEPWQAKEKARRFAPKPPALIRRSYLLDTWYHRIRQERDPYYSDYFDFVHEAYDNELWSVQQERLRLLNRIVESTDGKLVVVTFPFLHSLGPDYEYRHVHRMLDAFWQSEGVPHLDLLPMYERYKPSQLVVNARDAHPNPFAHSLAADTILEFLEPLMEPSP